MLSAESSTLDNTNIILDDDLNYLNINLDDTSTILDDAENSIQRKLGKKKDKVWDYFNVIDIPNNPHKGATCKYCSQS
ncbi:hypothetical protein RCL_jg11257.t1 [Rhizophagus clarus]|uniref:BED-type domain-containing protein n=1 Tax=Rhizophagus clarus TaxID=94130 RepID=A0A8H3QQ81_9GLOM|nr:hypothetical protein RCL_jg11257.t1 [Rhizophagus clarus]